MSSQLKNLSSYNQDEVPSGEKEIFGIVVSEWNNQITDSLLEGAVNTLLKYEVDEKDIDIIHVPGSFELPFGAAKLLEKNRRFSAIICLGCVIQGETRHFDFICDAVANGVTQVGIKHAKPVIFGVLTTDDQQQAIDRAGGKHGNKGDEAAITAIKMAHMAATL